MLSTGAAPAAPSAAYSPSIIAIPAPIASPTCSDPRSVERIRNRRERSELGGDEEAEAEADEEGAHAADDAGAADADSPTSMRRAGEPGFEPGFPVLETGRIGR